MTFDTIMGYTAIVVIGWWLIFGVIKLTPTAIRFFKNLPSSPSLRKIMCYVLFAYGAFVGLTCVMSTAFSLTHWDAYSGYLDSILPEDGNDEKETAGGHLLLSLLFIGSGLVSLWYVYRIGDVKNRLIRSARGPNFALKESVLTQKGETK